MKRFLYLLTSFLLLLTGCGMKIIPVEIVTETKTVNIPEQLTNDIPVMRFIIASDVHIKEYESVEMKRFIDFFIDSYKYADTQKYKNIDAAVIVGDFTDNGSIKQYNTFNNIWRQNIREETQMIITMGNHEWGDSNFIDFENQTGIPANNHNIINGFHFIGVSPFNGSDYTVQNDWVTRQLDAAVADDPLKPIFTFQHHHIKDTVYVSEEWYTTQLDDIYKNYSQNINFSGHSHAPINNPRSIYQKDYTLIGTGTLSYFECLSGMTYGTIPPNADQAAQFFIIEVFSDNSVKVSPYNLITHDFFHDMNTINYKDTTLTWIIDKPSDKTSFIYTTDRYKTSDMPLFSETSAVIISNITQKTAEVSFNQAQDSVCVYSYEIAVNEKENKFSSKIKNIFSEYYFEPIPKTLNYMINALKPDTDYEITITAINAYQKRSGNILAAAFKTEKAEPFVQRSGNNVTFKDTFTDFESYKSFEEGENFIYNQSPNQGDYWVGAWDSGMKISGSNAVIEEGIGYNETNGLAVWEDGDQNQGLYLYSTNENNNKNSFSGMNYMRVWMNLSGVDFRKANFGIFDSEGNLFTTDECDGYNNLFFFYMAENTDVWKEYKHGGDGCFGSDQASSVANFKGWFAFPIKDFTIRLNANPGGLEAGNSSDLSDVNGIYMFWDYSDSSMTGRKFYLDEIQFVDDYKIFKKIQ